MPWPHAKNLPTWYGSQMTQSPQSRSTGSAFLGEDRGEPPAQEPHVVTGGLIQPPLQTLLRTPDRRRPALGPLGQTGDQVAYSIEPWEHGPGGIDRELVTGSRRIVLRDQSSSDEPDI